MKFGASGLLKDEIKAGTQAEVFASANMEHPQALAGADYGLTVMNGASPAAYRFAMFILSLDGQRILAKQFMAPGI
jgi:ABC-type molybdate transport system substrate-binding protein